MSVLCSRLRLLYSFFTFVGLVFEMKGWQGIQKFHELLNIILSWKAVLAELDRIPISPIPTVPIPPAFPHSSSISQPLCKSHGHTITINFQNTFWGWYHTC